MPKKPRYAAVIDIGSNELKLQIAQTARAESLDIAKNIKYLEKLSYPLGLGRDTFHTGKMSFDKADKACEIIKNFLHVARDYGVRDLKTLATTAVREATNMEYILDQIKIKTGLTVDVIDDLEEKRYIYKLLTHFATDIHQQTALMVYIGAGNIGISLLENGKMPLLQNIRVGSLRIGELFGDIAAYTSHFYRLMEEYLASITHIIEGKLPAGIGHFIASGNEIEMIAKLSGAAYTDDLPLFHIPRKDFLHMYDTIKKKTTDRIAVDYGLDIDRADLLLPAACIYQILLRHTEAKEITASRVLPCDAVLYEMLYPKAFATMDKQFSKNTVLSAQMLAERFHAHTKHYTQVYEFSMIIFDKMKKMHGMGSRDKLLLQTAAILHDIGKFINHRNHYQHSYHIVRGSDIVGLSLLETEIVALICLFHARGMPTSLIKYSNDMTLDMENRMRVSKLAAILRIADALDRSHSQKLSAINVQITEEALVVRANTDANFALEQWSFADKSRFFEEVFGIKAVFDGKR